jgi:hypothetical protein
MIGNRTNKLLLLLIVLAAVLRFVDCIVDNPLIEDHLFGDPSRHWQNAGQFFHPNIMGAGDPIGYQFYLWLVRCLTGDNRFLVGAVTGILSVLTPWTYYRACRELGMSRSASLIAWALISWMPSLWCIFNYLMMETLLLFLLGVSLWMSARFLRKRNLSAFCIMVLAWVLAVLTRSSVVPTALVAIMYCWWVTNHRCLWGVVALVLIAVMLIPGTIRSYGVLGYPAPLGLSWIAKIIYRSQTRWMGVYLKRDGEYKCVYKCASPSCFVRPLSPLSSWQLERFSFETTRVSVDPNLGEEDWKEKYDSMPFGFNLWLRRQGENAVLLLFAQSWPDAYDPLIKCQLNYWLRWIWAPMILYTTVMNVHICRLRNWTLLPLITTLTFLFLLFQPFALIEGRYRKPLEPLLLLNFVYLAFDRRNKLLIAEHNG